MAKYNYGDKVQFYIRFDAQSPEQLIEGYVFIIDKYGTFEQQEEPSYDVFVPEMNMLFKHFRESSLTFVQPADDAALQVLQSI